MAVEALDRGEVRTADAGRELASCGVAQGGTALIVQPETRERLPQGTVGEIWLTGPSVAGGYWGKTTETTAVFRAELAAPDGKQYLRTGDLGFERDGELYVTGRMKELIIIRGRNIYPQDIERSMEKIDPELRRGACAAVSVEVDGEERLVVLQEVPQEILETRAAELETMIRHVVSQDHGLDIHKIVFLKLRQLPKTTSGKLQRLRAKRIFLSDSPADSSNDMRIFHTPDGSSKSTVVSHQDWATHKQSAVRPVEDLRHELLTWVSQRLGDKALALDPEQPLTSLGLDSLNAAELQAHVEQRFGYTVEVRQFFEGLTISSLATDIASHLAGRTHAIPKQWGPADHQGAAPPRPAITENMNGLPMETTTVREMASTHLPAVSVHAAAENPAKTVEFSVMFFSSDAEPDSGDKYALFLQCAAFADQHGFRAVWSPERHFHRFGGLFPNPSLLGAALATTTHQIRIRAGSVVLPLHNVVRAAEEWSVVDNLSGGRVDIAFATGWNADDFVLAPDNYSDRQQALFDGIEKFRTLWRGDAISLPNGKGEPTDISIFPKPIQRELATWITCSGGVERFEQAGALGANVLTALLFQDVDELHTKLDAYRRARAAHGHDPSKGHVTLMLHTFLGADEERARATVEAPFKRYLRDSVDLWRRGSVALDSLTSAEQASVLDFAFERYYHSTALFGTPERASQLVEQLTEVGVDEIACLIDFGVDKGQIVESLRHVSILKDRWSTARHRDSAPMPRNTDAIKVPKQRTPTPQRPVPNADSSVDELRFAVRNRQALAHKNSKGVLQKAYDFDLISKLGESKLLPYYPDLTGHDGATCWHEGRRVIMLGSNNYLGLTAHPRVREAAAQAARTIGPSVTGSRLMNGSTPAHGELERKLAHFLGREDALLLTTGYQANIGLLSAFMADGTVLVADEECHASIYDGAAVAGCRVIPFRHNDMTDLKHRLANDLHSMPAMVMIDGVYSMSGDLAPLAEIKKICDQYNVPLALDDAHGLGMVGATGRGVEEELGMLGCADILTGTFSKTMASVGGWLAGPRALMDWVRYYGRSMLFSAAMPPPTVAAAAAALDILISEPYRVAKIRELFTYWRTGLSDLGFDTGNSQTAIVPVIIGDEIACLQFARRLLEKGVYANCVMAPAVRANRAMIRTTPTAAHDKEHLDDALAIFAAVGRELSII